MHEQHISSNRWCPYNLSCASLSALTMMVTHVPICQPVVFLGIQLYRHIVSLHAVLRSRHPSRLDVADSIAMICVEACIRHCPVFLDSVSLVHSGAAFMFVNSIKILLEVMLVRRTTSEFVVHVRQQHQDILGSHASCRTASTTSL